MLNSSSYGDPNAECGMRWMCYKCGMRNAECRNAVFIFECFCFCPVLSRNEIPEIRNPKSRKSEIEIRKSGNIEYSKLKIRMDFEPRFVFIRLKALKKKKYMWRNDPTHIDSGLASGPHAKGEKNPATFTFWETGWRQRKTPRPLVITIHVIMYYDTNLLEMYIIEYSLYIYIYIYIIYIYTYIYIY